MSTVGGMGAVTLFVEEPRRSREFYERVLEREPVYEEEEAATFRLENILVNLLRRSEAPELVEPASIAEPGAGPGALLTLAVADTDAAVAALRAKGVELLNGPVDRPWGVRTACFSDPDGHVWELAQQLST